LNYHVYWLIGVEVLWRRSTPLGSVRTVQFRLIISAVRLHYGQYRRGVCPSTEGLLPWKRRPSRVDYHSH